MDMFRDAVQNALPFSLKVNKNLSRFSEMIFDKTHCTVSVSTLKRIFLYPEKTEPSRYSLDLICQAVGYQNLDDFIENQNHLLDFSHREVISMIRLNGYTDYENFKKIISEFSVASDLYDVIHTLVKLAVEKKDKETLSQLFELKFFEEQMNNYPPKNFFVQDLGLILRESEIIMELIPAYAKSPAAQKWYIEWFVDEDNLNGYYGALMEAYHKHKTNLEAQLFYHVLMCVRDLQNGISTSSHFDYLLQFRETEPIHFHPKIRRLALLMVYFNNDREIIDSLLDEVKELIQEINLGERAYTTTVFCNIVFFREDDYAIKKAIEYMNLNCSKSDYDINIYRNFNILKIYEAFVLMEDGKPKEAKAKLLSYNPLYQYPHRVNMYKKHYDRVNELIAIKLNEEEISLR